MSGFDVDALVADCVDALGEPDPRRAVRELLARTVRDPAGVADRLRPETAGITVLHNTAELTVIDVVWAPGMEIFAHDHRMWAAIAVYAGREDNAFFARDDGQVRAAGGVTLAAGDVRVLGADAVHAVANPGSGPTGAIHVYGGDFVRQPRSQWRPPLMAEEPYDATLVAETFAEANAGWRR
ncbi:MAG TPA: hypothetical protein VHE83_16850 [Mycobacteriales bacterium]|nr:hypothetical protein [Mycobacteriales bacterium]